MDATPIGGGRIALDDTAENGRLAVPVAVFDGSTAHVAARPVKGHIADVADDVGHIDHGRGGTWLSGTYRGGIW